MTPNPPHVLLPPTVAPDWHPRPAEWLAREPSPHAGKPNRPLFIGACPRSGTTLLRLMLDNHPEMAIPHETHFVRPLWWGRVRFGDLSEQANRRRAAHWIFGAKERKAWRLRDGRVPRGKAVRRVAKAPPTIGSLVEAAFRVYADAHGKPRWGDKRPSYSGFIAQLFEMFPDAQYINVVRDPRGSVASQIPMGWDPPEVAFPAAIARWEAAYQRTDHAAARLRPDQLLDVRYEHLVTDPHAELERICAFAGLQGGDAIDAMIRADRRANFRGVHERLTGPVTTASIERWRERLTPAQVALVEQATAPLMERFGYLPDADLDAEPDPAEARELERQRRLSRREWRRSQRGELIRRLRYRRPVAAVPRRRRRRRRAA